MTKFSKSLIKYEIRDEVYIKDGYEYELEGHGRLIFNGREHRLTYGEKKFHINKKFQINDASTSLPVGRYKTSDWLGSPGYKTKLIWEGSEYRLKQVQPDVSYSLFKRATWGHKKYHLCNENELIIYTFHIDLPVASLSGFSDKAYHGLIETYAVNPLIALAGFVLVEESFNDNA